MRVVSPQNQTPKLHMILQLVLGCIALAIPGALIVGSALLASRRNIWATRDPMWIDDDQERARSPFTPSPPLGRDSGAATSLAGREPVAPQ